MKRLIALMLVLVTVFSLTTASAAISATSNQRIATRNGPSTKYDETGSYYQAGTTVKVHTKSYDSANRIYWLQIELTYRNEKYRLYTGAKRINIDVSRVPAETSLDTAWLDYSCYGYAGPGYDYHCYNQWRVVDGTFVTIMEVENNFALIDYNNGSRARRLWVPLSALTGCRNFYGQNTYPETTTTTSTNDSWNNNWNNGYTEPYYCSEMNPQDVVGEWVTISSSSANVRKGPGTNYDQLGYVRENQIFFVYDWSNGNTAHYWLKIYWNNTYAWINSGTCTLSN